MLSVTPIPAFNDNYIWLLRQDSTTDVTVVDPGDAQPVIEYLERESLNLSTILITHHHHDHTGGLPELTKRYAPRVIGPDNPNIEEIGERVADGDDFRVLGRRFEVLAVPGHTLDHIAFFASGTPSLLFCGDTLFCGGCGRLFEGTPEQMHRSLSRLASLPEDTLVFAAHEYTLANLRFAQAAEPDNRVRDRLMSECQRARDLSRPTLPSTIGRERQVNPFLRVDNEHIRSTAAAQGPTDSPDITFATLRHWKDNF
ncbi:hydroxyacylglutathione hydrolase [Modicisalibacter ilicicola DSM 19980]|uniref:Hydroxyacylglutathione hydrolase n=1 Tax=Modicisalibacter ilicicola DSM 19980 TaxID=1121942 RepID=A0A1M5E2V3_9GAMM|nr:hydroxyacylglutathione hydrolase [Halomonas ilicicola]SHF73547.1 hydroxyacylglutathione hydrolase [Halomonas ilicicola DSM 19980]